MNLKYIICRIIRRLIPSFIISLLSDKQILIKPGMGTRDPEQLVKHYINALNSYKISLKGKTVAEFGYGGFFGTALEFLLKFSRSLHPPIASLPRTKVKYP